MAVSGRKFSDFRDSLSHGSAEEVDHFCEPCLTTGQYVDADEYCVDCGEYLCKTCSDYHLRTKASKNHNLVDKDKAGIQPTTKDFEVCTEKCPEHKQEVIKYFCPQHDYLGCHVCKVMYHNTCEVDYIPDQCADVANSEDYKRTVHRLDLKLQELNKITKTIKLRDQEINKCHQNLLHEIIKFRKEINDYLDHLQEKIQKKADKKKAEDKQIIQKILDGCDNLSSDIKKMQSTMQANETAGKFGQLYIAVKQAQSVLRSDEIKAEDGLERTGQQYKFECNSSVMDMLSKHDGFGKLNLNSVLTTPRRNMITFHRLTKTENINVRTKSDKYECYITGCAVLSSNKLVLADYYNQKLKVVNLYTKSMTDETSLDSQPGIVAVLSQDQIAVTKPKRKEVVIMTYGDKMSTVKTISGIGQCRGITYHHGQLYVVCQDPLCVRIFNKEGNKQNTIYLNGEIFSGPRYLVVSEETKLLYISDWKKDCVVCITLQGEVITVYKHKDLHKPLGMLILDDGSLLVCCVNGTIHRILGDLNQGQKLTDGLGLPYSICYNHHLHEVYTGGEGNLVTVLIPQ